MRRTGNIYALTTPTGTPFYVGRTVQSPGTRAGDHLRDARHRDSELHRLLRSTERVGVWVLENGVALGELSSRERFWIDELTRAGFKMLNYCGGGNGCLVQTERAKAAIRAAVRRQARCPVTGRYTYAPLDAGEAVAW